MFHKYFSSLKSHKRDSLLKISACFLVLMDQKRDVGPFISSWDIYENMKWYSVWDTLYYVPNVYVLKRIARPCLTDWNFGLELEFDNKPIPWKRAQKVDVERRQMEWISFCRLLVCMMTNLHQLVFWWMVYGTVPPLLPNGL